MASPGNQQCASCIGTLSFLMDRYVIGELRSVDRGEDKGGLGGLSLPSSQPLKLAPPQKNTTDVAPPHMSYHRKFLPVGVSVTHVPVLLGPISRTLALLNIWCRH